MKQIIMMLLVFALVFFTANALGHKKGKSKKTPSATTINFQYVDGLIYIKGQINNKKDLIFLLNTGANISVLNKAIAEELGISLLEQDSVEGTAGKEKVNMIRIQNLKVGNELMKDVCVTKRDLSAWKMPNGKTVDGILGMDFLKNLIVTIDYNELEISFSNVDKSKSKFENSILFTLEDGGIPKMEMMLNESLSLPIRYNSGVSLQNSEDIYVNISTTTWKKLKEKNRFLSPQLFLTGNAVGGNLHLPVSRIEKLQIGNVLVMQPYVIIQPEEGYFKKADAIGFIGNNFFEKYGMVCFDFRESKISFNEPDIKRKSGEQKKQRK